jgi:hypothetical protein
MRRIVLGSALTSLTVLVIGLAAGPAHAADDPLGPPGETGEARRSEPAPPLSDEETALLRRQDDLMPAAQALTDQSRDAGSDIAGVEIDVPASLIHVYRTDPSQPLRLPEPPREGVRIEVHQAAVDRSTMIEVGTQIRRDAQSLADDGVLVQSTGPAVDGSGVSVAVAVSRPDAETGELERASEVLRQRYGTAVGEVRGVARPAAYQGDFFAGMRFNDFPGWWGGDRIVRQVSGGFISCTSGFPAVRKSNNQPVMLTAAHCGDVGTVFRNGPRNDGTFKTVGTTVISDVDADVAAIAVSSTDNKINVGSVLAPKQLPITGGWASPVVGQLLCQSGSFTGEVCGLKVVDTDVDNCDLWFIFCLDWRGPLSDVINTAGPSFIAAGHGDSGGPVYRRNAANTGVTAEGLISSVLTDKAAAKFPAFAPDNISCPAPGAAVRTCSSGFAFAQMPGH